VAGDDVRPGREVSMKNRVTMLAITAVALMAASCGDSGSPTGPDVSAPTTANLAGTWTGVFFGCSAMANFTQAGVSVRGTLQTNEPCRFNFDFEGAIHGNALSGTYTDYEIYKLGANGTVSGSELEITLTDFVGNVFGRLLLHR
jgi:hypothetical protein